MLTDPLGGNLPAGAKPSVPDKESNWLPAPDGPFALALRIYWPGQEILDGEWEPSAIRKA